MNDRLPCEVGSVLPAYLRPAIPYENFNKMQVECLEAWNSDCNLLVSAPTGSGKTVCFELALLRRLHVALESSETKHLGPSGLNGKVVFVAPTKAICTERGNDWKRRYAFTGLRVEVITGDVRVSASDFTLLNADLVITTAEKWDSLTRSIGSQTASDIMSQICLLLLDEVHQLGDSRGAIVESVVTRMLVTSDEVKRDASSVTDATPIASLRVIAVSATVKNVKDVGIWLRVDPNHVMEFDQSYRPVELEYKLLGYHIRNPWQASQVYDSQTLEILRKFGDGKPALVFCPSRRQTRLSAKALVERLNRDCPDPTPQGNFLTRHLSLEQRCKLRSFAANCSDRALATVLSNGVAMHNAEMSPGNRHLVELLFRESLVLCLFSTSTLAQGVNLPARLVIIAGTAVYRNGSLEEYNRSMLLQMTGRAGRLGLDTKGVAAIMTSKSCVRQYENIQKVGPAILESQLESRLEECINAEIARQFITDVPSAVFFLTNTFSWIREKKKRRSEYQNDEDKLRALVTSTAMTVVNKLANAHLVRFDDDYFGVSSTSAGLTMAKYCLSFETLRLLMTEIPKASSPAQVLRIISACREVLDGVCIRRAEKRRLNEMNEFVRLPVRGKVKEPVDKAVILLQMVLGDNLENPNVDFALRSEALRLVQSVSRVCSCLSSLILDLSLRAPYEAIFSVLQVCRGLTNHCYWDGPTVLRQIPGISPVRAKELARHGISTIDALARADFGVIDNLLCVKVPFANMVLERLKEFPKFHVQTVVRRSSEPGGRISQIEVHITVSAQIGHWKPRKRGERGFILVGSHSRGFVDAKTFRLDESNQHFVFHVPPDGSPRRGKWIDIIVGSDGIIGIDECTRFPLEEPYEGLIQSQDIPSQRPRSMTVKELKASGKSSKLLVTHGRVSKRFVQTTVPQALGQSSKHAMTTAFIRGRANKRVATPGTLPSRQTAPVKRSEDVSITSPDTSPEISPASPSPAVCDPTGDSTETQKSIDPGPDRFLLEGNKNSGTHARFEPLFAATNLKRASGPLASGAAKDPACGTTDSASGSKVLESVQSYREYDEVLRSLF